jgi:hypothetical protein
MGLSVQKLKPAISFYELLGFRLQGTKGENWGAYGNLKIARMVDDEGMTLELVEGKWKDHICIEVDEIMFYRDDMPVKETSDCCVKFIKDPSGNWVELFREI